MPTQPLLGVTPVALAAFREGDAVRALAAVQPQLPYPVPDILPETDPSSPPPLIPPFPLPGDGYLLRESASGWRDEQRTAYAGSTADRPLKSDPVAALLVDGDGQGWALGGWSGEADAAGRGNGNRSSQGRADRARVQTGAVYRYATADQPASPPALTRTGVDLTASVARFAVAGHAQCEQACTDVSDATPGPDSMLRAAKTMVTGLAGQSGGPRMLLYTGGRLPAGDAIDRARGRPLRGTALAGRGRLRGAVGRRLRGWRGRRVRVGVRRCAGAVRQRRRAGGCDPGRRRARSSPVRARTTRSTPTGRAGRCG